MAKMTREVFITNAKDYFFIILGLFLYALGFTAFILPHEVVMGGLAGVGTLVYFATAGKVSVGLTVYLGNLILLSMAYKIVGRTFVLRTIFGATIVSLMLACLENVFMALEHPLIAETSMSVIIGGILCGVGVGTIFIHNGSSGGTDIIAAMVSKVSNVSIGRTMMFVDAMIVISSIFLPYDGTIGERLEARVPIMVYGFVVTFVIAYFADQVINSNRQATQFIILSVKWEEIASAINNDAHRGVTVLDGMGWYTKKEVKMLMVWCRKIESVNIFRIVKSIDDNAIVTQGQVNGVYGKGFDTMRIKKIKSKTNPQENK